MILALTNNPIKNISECSLCGTKENDTEVLVAGIEGIICDKCIRTSNMQLLLDVGVFTALGNQYIELQKKIQKAFVLIIILFALTFTTVIATTIFRHF